MHVHTHIRTHAHDYVQLNDRPLKMSCTGAGAARAYDPPFSDLELNVISQEIPLRHWEELGLRLGLSVAELERVRYDNSHNPRRAVFQMLVAWRQTQSIVDDHRTVLLNALMESRLVEVAEFIALGDVTSSPGTLDLDQFRKELSQYYLNVMCKIKFIPWDEESYIDLQKFYTKLSLVVQDFNAKILDRPETLRPLPRSHDDIYSAACFPEERRPMRLLIEGEAGMGKSTLVAKLAYDWATGADSSPLRDTPCFLAVPFQEWNPSWSIGTAVRECLLAKDSAITAKQIDVFIKAQPQSVKIAVDGYDEAKFSIRDEEPSGRIGRALRYEELRDCHILVTTRSSRVEDFHGLIRHYTRIQIEGFQKEETEKYVKYFFQSQPEKAEYLMKYIREHHLTSEYLSGIPLFTAMLCELVSEVQTRVDDLNEFDTLGDLFRYFIKYLWGQHATKSSSLQSPDESEKVLSALLLHLGKVGLNGLFSPDNKLVFKASDFSSSEGNRGQSEPIKMEPQDEVAELGCQIGILTKQRKQVQVKTKLKRRTAEKSHAISFFHKFAQEYCAGVYLAHLSKTDDASFMKYLQQICSRAELLNYKNILLFACGEGIEPARGVVAHLARLHEKWVYMWDTNDNALEIALLCNLESKSGGHFNELLKRFMKSGTLDVWVSPFQHEPHISVAYRYLLAAPSSLPMEECKLAISKKENLDVFFDFMTSASVTSLTGLELNVSSLKEESYLRFLECLREFRHLSSLKMTTELEQPTRSIDLLNRAPSSCRYPSVLYLRLQNGKDHGAPREYLTEYLAYVGHRFPNVNEVHLDSSYQPLGLAQSVMDKAEDHGTHLHSLRCLTIADVSCDDQPLATLFDLISDVCPNLEELDLKAESKSIQPEVADSRKIMTNLKRLELTLKKAADPQDIEDVVAFLSDIAPALRSLTLDGSLSYATSSGRTVFPATLNENVEHLKIIGGCKSEGEFARLLHYFPKVKSLEMFTCEPFKRAKQEPSPLVDQSTAASSVVKLVVNCSSLAQVAVTPNHVVLMNHFQKEPMHLSFLAYAQHVTSLDLLNLPFKNLNFSGCPQLPLVRHLRLQGLFLHSAKGIVDFFKKLPSLASCQVPYSVNDCIINDLCTAIAGRKGLRVLVIGIDVGLPENVRKIVAAAASLPLLEHLVFRVSSLHGTLLSAVATSLAAWTKLTFLGIHPYQLMDQGDAIALDGVEVMLDACASHRSLTGLDLSVIKMTKDATLRALQIAAATHGSPTQFSLRFTGPHIPCDWEVYSGIDTGIDAGYVELVPPDKTVRYGTFHDGAGPVMTVNFPDVSVKIAIKDAMYYQSVGVPDIESIFGSDNDTGIDTDIDTGIDTGIDAVIEKDPDESTSEQVK